MIKNRRKRRKNNRLFLMLVLLLFAVGGINIKIYDRFDGEHVVDSRFQKHFKTSRHENVTGEAARTPSTRRAPSPPHEEQVGGGNSTAAQSPRNEHKLAGLRCAKYGGPEDWWSEKEMAFWSDIPSDASYKSPFMDMDGTERFLTFEP